METIPSNLKSTIRCMRRNRCSNVVFLLISIQLFFIRGCQSFQLTLTKSLSRRSSSLHQHYRLYPLSQLSLSSKAITTGFPNSQIEDLINTEEEETIFDQEQRRKDPNSRTLSYAAQWHRQRRQEMLQKYGDQIAPLEKFANSQWIGLTLLLASNLTLAALSIVCGSLPLWQVFLLGLFPGSILSLWQLQILHDNIHGCLLDKQKQSFSLWPNVTVSKRQLQDAITFWGSMPSVFGYFLYLKYGHLTHHAFLGSASLGQVFDSSSRDLDDGDILFVAHRMNLLGTIGPTMSWNTNTDTSGKSNAPNNSITMSISRSGFSFWKPDHAIWNAAVFATSFMFERVMLVVNDVVVALTGRNFFFPNKPIQEFQEPCAAYSRCAVLVRLLLLVLGGSWKSLFFLYLAETLWSLPPHPACAMFITNHGSNHNTEDESSVAATKEACIPSSSTYAGRWYSILTLGTNYHCEHHDFPTIPLDKLCRLHEIAPEYYNLQRPSGRPIADNLWKVMTQAFAKPNYYACMNDLHLAAPNGRAETSTVDRESSVKNGADLK